MLGISYRQSRHRIDGSRAEWVTMEDIEGPLWPVDLRDVRLWPMESEDGPLLQELFDDLTDFRSAFGEPGMADAVSTFLNVPEETETGRSDFSWWLSVTGARASPLRSFGGSRSRLWSEELRACAEA